MNQNNIFGIPIIVDPKMAKGTFTLVKDDDLKPNPHVRVDSMETAGALITLMNMPLEGES